LTWCDIVNKWDFSQRFCILGGTDLTSILESHWNGGVAYVEQNRDSSSDKANPGVNTAHNIQ